MSTLITDISSFVGFNLCRKLLSKGENVIGLYANPARIETLTNSANAHHLTLINVALNDEQNLQQIVHEYRPSTLFHFSDFGRVSAQAASALSHLMTVLEACKNSSVTHCLLNSSNAVYLPHQYSTMASNELSEHPQNLAAATARSCELLSHAYSFQYALPCTVVRFFEVYGNAADEDNLVHSLWQKVAQHQSIDLNDYPIDLLDFTYIDDVCNALLRLQEHPAKPNPDWQLDEDFMDSSTAPWRIYNIGTGVGTPVLSLLEMIAEVQGQPLHFTTQQTATAPFRRIADVKPLLRETGYQPRTSLYAGLRQMLARSY
ncbi:NAD-dependent epimerase/dehydratase family protein [Alteromonas sp. a30]|uniref:NAD-dependent epimerase/dehydratase family protein n=1 Tax=Alteromonas sp. a30 TaxID=2730917 RepID=UPI0022825939|nr:NAD-dependent epimerase/dehydratase family protein [Alteromonas sp. a30]MCY7295575.1 NAD-dependent epimerase/dehydratase family protein [Alteromonas sp. a30]